MGEGAGGRGLSPYGRGGRGQGGEGAGIERTGAGGSGDVVLAQEETGNLSATPGGCTLQDKKAKIVYNEPHSASVSNEARKTKFDRISMISKEVLCLS